MEPPPRSVTSNGHSQGSLWIVAARIVAALGGPALGWAGFADWARSHPWLAALLLVLYELLVFCAQIVGEIWKRLKDQWIDAAAQALDYRVQEILSGYRKKYLEHLFYECRDFDVKGLTTQGTYTLELQRVFVELSIEPRPPHENISDPIPKLPTHLLQGRHDIWEYLQGNSSLAIVGAPGSGKTTLLKHIALVLALRGKHPKGKRAPKKLPVLLFARSHAKAISGNPELSLADVIRAGEIVKNQQVPGPSKWFEHQLEKGRCIILLDGLDEIGDAEVRRKVVDWVEKRLRTHPKNPFVITSRPHGYRQNPIEGVHTLAVRPFDSEQIREFVSNWYLANEIVGHNRDDPGVRKEAAKGARDLMSRLRGSDVLNELAVNPLLLTMIATVHRYRSELPGRRVELYREICEVFLGKRQDVRGVERVFELTPGQKQRVLEPLAYQMMVTRTREVSARVCEAAVEGILRRVSPQASPGDFFRMIEDTAGLLVERENGEYSFAHKTFQEYLAAVHCRNQGLAAELIKRVEDDWWHETIRLYVAESDATPILEVCLKLDPPGIQALILAIECVEEAQQIDECWRDELTRVLAGGTLENDARRRICGEALLALRLRKLVAIDTSRFLDTALITQAEYQLFLDQTRARGEYHEPQHWISDSFESGQGNLPVAGVRATDAEGFCHWLTERQNGGWAYRLPFASESEEEPTESRQRSALESFGCWCACEPDKYCIRGASAKSISRFRNETMKAAESALRRLCPGSFAFQNSFWGLKNLMPEIERSLDRAQDSDLMEALVKTLDIQKQMEFRYPAFDQVRTVRGNPLAASGHVIYKSPEFVDLCMSQALETELDWTRSMFDRIGFLRDNELFLYVDSFFQERKTNFHEIPALESAIETCVFLLLLWCWFRDRISGADRRMAFKLLSSVGFPLFSIPIPILMYSLKFGLFKLSVIFMKLLPARLRPELGSPLKDFVDTRVNHWLYVFLQLVISKGRRGGDVPLLGAIRIVRERISEAKPSVETLATN
jgi:hypothetical protein